MEAGNFTIFFPYISSNTVFPIVLDDVLTEIVSIKALSLFFSLALGKNNLSNKCNLQFNTSNDTKTIPVFSINEEIFPLQF